MHAGICCLTTLLLSTLYLPRADAAIRHFDVMNPRDFGYVIGDMISRRIVLKLEGQYRLDPDSFPRSGRITRWVKMIGLESSVETDSQGMLYTLTITYQIMDIPRESKVLSVPELALQYGDGGHALALVIPSWRFTVTPLVGGKAARNTINIVLQPDRVPPLMTIESRITRAVFMAIIMVATAIALIYALTGIPFLSRSQGPFALAYRELRRHRQNSIDDAGYLDALRCVHQAFNLTAGRVLFANQIDILFDERPAFRSLRSSIERFYTHSREAFYGNTAMRELPPYSIDCLLDLCRRCRDVERGLS